MVSASLVARTLVSGSTLGSVALTSGVWESQVLASRMFCFGSVSGAFASCCTLVSISVTSSASFSAPSVSVIAASPASFVRVLASMAMASMATDSDTSPSISLSLGERLSRELSAIAAVLGRLFLRSGSSVSGILVSFFDTLSSDSLSSDSLISGLINIDGFASIPSFSE